MWFPLPLGTVPFSCQIPRCWQYNLLCQASVVQVTVMPSLIVALLCPIQGTKAVFRNEVKDEKSIFTYLFIFKIPVTRGLHLGLRSLNSCIIFRSECVCENWHCNCQDEFFLTMKDSCAYQKTDMSRVLFYFNLVGVNMFTSGKEVSLKFFLFLIC